MGNINGVRIFAGFVTSDGELFAGKRAPAALTFIDRGDQYECKFLFFVNEFPVAITVFAPNTGQSTIAGQARDPRGWDVSFTAELQGSRVVGTFDQPHDHGGFAMQEI